MMVCGPKKFQVCRKCHSLTGWEGGGNYKETIRIIFKYMKVHHGLKFLYGPKEITLVSEKFQVTDFYFNISRSGMSKRA